MTVSLEDKRKFINHTLTNYAMVRKESVWVLHYLSSYDDYLEKVYFVENAEHTPRGLIMSTNSKFTPFCFYNEGLMTENAEKVFNSIRSNPPEDLYISLILTNETETFKTLAEYGVLEENPFDNNENKNKVSVPLRRESKKFLDAMTKDFKRASLVYNIDKALDEGNEKEFKRLSSTLIKMDAKKEGARG